MARPQDHRSLWHRASDHPHADGGTEHGGAGDRRRGSRRPRRRSPAPRSSPEQIRKRSRHHPPADGKADQPELLHPQAAAARRRPRGQLESAAGALLRRVRHRSREAGAAGQPRALRRRHLRDRRGVQAGDRQLPFRPAGAAACWTRVKAAGCQGDGLRHHGARRRNGSPIAAATRSSPRATRPAAIAACS